MVKSVLGVNHQALTLWLIQRISAVIMTLYSLGLIAFFLMHPGLGFYEWHDLFCHLSMKVATLLVLASLLLHTWIGIWTVLTDYIKIFGLRLFLYVVIFLALIAFFFEGMLILWGCN